MALQAAYEYLQQAVGHGAWSSTQTLTLLLIAVPTVLLLLASLAKSTSSSGRGKPPLPPSPPGTLPIVGHLHHIGPQTHIGRDPAVWEKPEEFMPERFMRDGWDKSNSYSGQDFRYLPFGSGRRICPGANFALATMEIMLANLMYHFDWEVPNEKEDGGGKVSMDETFGLMLRRNEPLYLVPRAV
ncbi:benzoxazinone synthesis5 [Zea mays]|uniref:Benzoxazinone synthesis5 n=1 Tax=Zea mays TaxID=4577 RepID=A0A1D6PP69_MAIZE|nr:benzoxazinone synthesis5 [Zea mays]